LHSLQIADRIIPLGIDISGDVVGDFASEMTETTTAIECCRTDPERPTTISIEICRLPEPNVMALAGTTTNRLLESQILWAILQGLQTWKPAHNRSSDWF
jgi:hypothetical protein